MLFFATSRKALGSIYPPGSETRWSIDVVDLFNIKSQTTGGQNAHFKLELHAFKTDTSDVKLGEYKGKISLRAHLDLPDEAQAQGDKGYMRFTYTEQPINFRLVPYDKNVYENAKRLNIDSHVPPLEPGQKPSASDFNLMDPTRNYRAMAVTELQLEGDYEWEWLAADPNTPPTSGKKPSPAPLDFMLRVEDPVVVVDLYYLEPLVFHGTFSKVLSAAEK
ncbi:MAG: hypothetical protein U0931_11685 [Vulcanimicrobiota bacterium]